MIDLITITGASSEIGRAIARKLDGMSNRFLLHGFAHSAILEETARALTTSADIVTADFSDENSLQGFCARIASTDILINAAAVTRTDLLATLSDADITAMLRVNINALIAVCRAVLPSMYARRRGVIVNISSIAASRGNRGQTVYAGTKGFVESFSRALASETGSRNIRVNCIAPGPIDAGSFRSVMEYAGDEVAASMLSRRLGTPDDVASLVRYLCSDEAAYIIGEVIRVDGGFLRGVG